MKKKLISVNFVYEGEDESVAIRKLLDVVSEQMRVPRDSIDYHVKGLRGERQ
jgi:hypothetical protein